MMMTPRVRGNGTWLGVLLALTASGCAVSHKTVVKPSEVRPAEQASEAQLIAAYNLRAAAIHSINASVELIPTAGSAYSGVIEQYHQVNGFILAQKPADIRVIGQAPVLSKNIFDMVSDGKTFRIYIPSKNQFLVGPANLERQAKKPIENLRPQHLLDALFWPEIAADAPLLFEEVDQPPARYYVITLIREGSQPAILRKLWFDRADLDLARIQVYGQGGRVVSDVQLSDWQSVAGPATGAPVAATSAPGSVAAPAAATAAAETEISYPRQILLRRPQDDYQLEMKITKIAVNETIAASRFELAQPAGTELIRLGENAGPER
jgi:outer membrane lipoprotein-sorting protein